MLASVASVVVLLLAAVVGALVGALLLLRTHRARAQDSAETLCLPAAPDWDLAHVASSRPQVHRSGGARVYVAERVQDGVTIQGAEYGGARIYKNPPKDS